jgi:hypothetical protein
MGYTLVRKESQMSQERQDILNRIADLHTEISITGTQMDRIARENWDEKSWLEGCYSELLENVTECNSEIAVLGG